jgi:hypothetical protein
MNNVNWNRAAIIGCAAALGIWALVASVPGFAQDTTPMGPKDVAEITIESLPDWVSEGVVNPASGVRGGGQVQILAVLKDPRDVPVDRFLYALTDHGEVIVHPQANQIRDHFPEGKGSAVAVYVRVTADESTEDEYVVYDPFFIDSIEHQEINDWVDAPWRAIGVASTEDPQLILPCLEPMTIEEGVKDFDAPDTGARISPDEYLPPLPHYEVIDQEGTGNRRYRMESGEVREGWMLCLAPEVPVDQIRVVFPGNLFQELGTYGQGRPYWERREEMSTGEWARFEDQVVVGWNGEAETDIYGIPQIQDEEVIYEGDVWVSVAQALRYGASPPEGETAQVVDVFIIQLYFEGMTEFLETWDHIALRNLFEVDICEDIEELDCAARTNHYIQAVGERISRKVDVDIYTSPLGAAPDKAWIRLGERKDYSIYPDYKIWGVDIVTTDDTGQKITDYMPGDYIPEDAIFNDYKGDLYDPKGGSYFHSKDEVPIIPLGQMANGIRVVRAWFEQGEVLRVTRLHFILRERDDFDPANSKWMFIEIQNQGRHSSLKLLGKAEEGWSVIGNVDSEAYYGTSAGYEVVGNTWDAITRAATKNAVLMCKVPINWKLEDLLIAQPEGPAWRLR